MKTEMDIRHKKRGKRALLCLLSVLMLTGCGRETLPVVQSASEGSETVIPPVGNTGGRRRLDMLPAVQDAVENPGTRQHFSFTMDDKKFIFTETDTLWMYNQSVIGDMDTQFLLNVKGRKVTIVRVKPEEQSKLSLEDWSAVYSDDVVTIYREDGEKAVTEDESMYLTLYGVTWQVYFWSETVNKKVITLDRLYQELAQMGTAIVPAEEDETLSDLIQAMGVNPVLEDYKLAFRTGIPYSGFIFCSPSSELANYDDISILMSIQVPEWGEYATLHIEKIPDYQDRLEDTGEVFDDHTVWADYTGELKYFILGTDDVCVWLEGMPSTVESDAKSFTAKDAAYIFELFLTK